MSRSRTLICQPIPNVIYISEQERTYTNSFRLSLTSAEACGAVRGNTERTRRAASARMTIQCEWEKEESSLCSLENAKDIRVSSEDWKARWKRTGWEIEPPQEADLSQEFSLSLCFDNVVTWLREGTAILHVTLHSFPGYEDEAPFTVVVERRYALCVERFESDREKVERGCCCTLDWRVVNSNECFLDGAQVKAEDSRTVFPVTDPQNFMLMAQNAYGAIVNRTLQVSLTNWSAAGMTSRSSLPLKDDPCASNAEIYGHGGKFYTFVAGFLYETADMEQPDWRKVSGPEAAEKDYGLHTCLCTEEGFLVICRGMQYLYSFREGKWSGTKNLLAYGDGRMCRAVLFQGEPLYASVYEKNMLILSCYERQQREWDNNYFLDADAEIAGFDLLEFQGDVYAAVQKKAGGIVIYRTEDLEVWKQVDTAEGSGWFRLLTCKRRLFLIRKGGILDLEGGDLYRDFPDLSKADDGIRVCMMSDRVYLVLPGEEEQINSLRFRP